MIQEMTIDEKRLHPRFECDLPVSVITENEEWNEVAVDIGIGGMKITSHRLLNIDQPVRLRFSDIYISARVCWKRENFYGLQFHNLQSEEIVRLLELCDGSPEFNSFSQVIR